MARFPLVTYYEVAGKVADVNAVLKHLEKGKA